MENIAKIEVEVNKVGYGKYLHKVSTHDRSYLERVLGKQREFGLQGGMAMYMLFAI